MMPETQPQPDRAAMLSYLAEITRGWADLGEPVSIELRCLFPGRTTTVTRYSPDAIGFDMLCDQAAAMNAAGLNCYTVVNPIRADAPLRRNGKLSGAEDTDIVAAFLFWADGDDAEAARRIVANVGPKYTFAVTTGRTPSPRPHVYWRIEDGPVRNLAAWSGVQRAIAAALHTDPSVVNPSRIMRLPGTINWPVPHKVAKGYIAELTTLRTAYDDERAPVTFDQMRRAYGDDAPAGATQGAFRIDTGGYETLDRERARIAALSGKEWHNAVIRLVASYVARGMTDSEIYSLTDPLTLAGYTVEQTRSEVATAIAGARRKGWTPDPEDTAGPSFDAPPGDDAKTGESGAAGAKGAAYSGENGPVDLWGVFRPPPLPRDLLPKVIEDFAFIQGAQMGADPAGLAAAALCVCCAAIPDDVQLRVKRHDAWHESARIWIALVGDPSTRKSPILAAAERPLRIIDAEMYRKYAREKAEWDALKKDEKSETPRPKQERRRLEDTTIEAAQEVMADSPGGVLVIQDELSGWFGSMDRYGNGKGKDRGFWLQAFNGGVYAFNRIGRGAGMVENLSACVLGGIQPEPIRRVVAEATDDGLIQRLFPIILAPATLGSEDAPSTDAALAYGETVGRLCRAEIMPSGFSIDTGSRRALTFDAGAQAYRRELEQQHLRFMAVECINRKLAAHVGKYDGLFARLCVAWHCVEADGGIVRDTITEATARRAGMFLHRFLLPHAIAFYGGVLGLSDDHDRITAVAAFILAKGLTAVSARDVARGDATMRKLTRFDTMKIFEQLEALGWVAQLPQGRVNAAPAWVVNPAVHSMFAERRDAETARRSAAHEIMTETLRN